MKLMSLGFKFDEAASTFRILGGFKTLGTGDLGIMAC
jgi:hypothetical protein